MSAIKTFYFQGRKAITQKFTSHTGKGAWNVKWEPFFLLLQIRTLHLKIRKFDLNFFFQYGIEIEISKLPLPLQDVR